MDDTDTSSGTVRMGTLGAARITPMALLRPARRDPAVAVTTVAARDRGRAEAWAQKRHIPRVADSYEALLADPDIDAVYNPLPNGLHGQWTIKALEAGKHVLCEKPFTANATEAEQVAAVAADRDLVVMEAFHWRFHPMAQRIIDIVASGELGQVRHVETSMCVPLPMRNDIRFDLALAGGAQMDVGAYGTHMARHIAGEEPTVTTARAKLIRPGVDRAMQADIAYPSGATGRMTVSLWSARLLDIRARVTGTDGTLSALNPVGPQMFHRLKVTTPEGSRVERFTRRHTYEFQLDAFRDAVLHSAEVVTPPSDSVATMRVIDDVYRAAGLDPRPVTV